MVVRMRHTKSKTRMRRSHHGVAAPTLSTCSHCGATHTRHQACRACGYYRGRQVIDIVAKKERKTARRKARADKK